MKLYARNGKFIVSDWETQTRKEFDDLDSATEYMGLENSEEIPADPIETEYGDNGDFSELFKLID